MANTSVQRALKFSVYESLKPEEETVVREFLSSKDVFAALPTGYGKSLCYACLPYAFDNMRGKEGSIVICVSPLTSLMVDQKAKFVPRAQFVGEAQCDPQAVESVRKGKAQLLFISPESLLSNPRTTANSGWRQIGVHFAVVSSLFT